MFIIDLLEFVIARSELESFEEIIRCCLDADLLFQPGTVGVVNRLDRITIIPSICHGKPTVRGMRYSVEDLLGWLASGMTVEEILDDYPDLEHEDILAALEFGALAAGIHDSVELRAA